MTKNSRLMVCSAIVSSAIAVIVLRDSIFVCGHQELSSDGPLYIKSLSLSDSGARLDTTGDKPVILFPVENWDKVAAVARQLCLDIGCAGVGRGTSRHRGPPLGFPIGGYVEVDGINYSFCTFRFDFYDLNDASVEVTVFIHANAHPDAMKKYSKEYLIKELARRIGIPVVVPPLD